ncbi:MAG: hypothetical protein ABI634_18285 [Acidobacteriota bacterium]
MPLYLQKADDAQGDGSFSTVPITLGASPTVGNVLLAFIATGDFPSPFSVTKPDALWSLVREDNFDFCGMHVYTRVVQSGDGVGPYIWSVGNSDNHHGVIYEYPGIDTTTPVDAHATNSNGGSPVTLALSATPTVEGAFAVAGYSNDSGGISSTITSGWALDVNQSVGHPSDTASKNAVTSGLGAVAVTFTQNFGNSCIGTIVLLKPASGGAGDIGVSAFRGFRDAGQLANLRRRMRRYPQVFSERCVR